MPVSSAGKIVKTRKGKKGGTQHQKNHRWESFTTKISKLSSLDPIRRVRRHDSGDSALATSDFSYFRASLEKWQELNLSSGFVSFTQDVSPLCDTLAQVLHFEKEIMDLLGLYIEKGERESLEPLLELLTDFAHDLGVRFERHYQRALELVTGIVGTVQQDAAVIEWSFTSLAFIFKYLSKLLVPNLQPTYDVLAPLLGKRRQPPHIARFAAEAMSYLVKKAGAPANRTKALPVIVAHVKQDLSSMLGKKEFSLYYHGVMTLFAEAIKGNGMAVHTNGPAVFQALLEASKEQDLQDMDASPWEDVISGVLTSILHHTAADTFKDILGVVVSESNKSADDFSQSKSGSDLHHLLVLARLLGVVAGVRKASRIQDWQAVLKAMSNILGSISKNSSVVERETGTLKLFPSVIMSVSILMQYSPMDTLIPLISTFMDALIKDPLAKWFFVFTSYFADNDSERFKNVALPYFKRFVIAHWSEDNGDSLCVLLPKMVASGVLPSNYGEKGFQLPQSWQDQIVSKFERLEVSPFPEQTSPATYDRSPKTWHDRCLPKYNALLDVLECTSVHPSTNARIAEILLRKLKLALRPSSSLAPEEANFIVGRGFSAYSRMSREAGELDKSLRPLLRAAAPRYSRLPEFLEALLTYEESLEKTPTNVKSPPPDTEDNFVLMKSLVSNLSTGSPELRLRSLRLLEHIHITEQGSSSKPLTAMIQIEQTHLDLQTVRLVSMSIRNLVSHYSQELDAVWIRQAIVAFCFGMLTIKFAQIWEDAAETLKQISISKIGEEDVAQMAFDWLRTPSLVNPGGSQPVDETQNGGLTDFECSNLIRLQKLSRESESGIQGCRDIMLSNFANAQEPVPARPQNARSQALRVLNAIPSMAERRSVQLVPMFLSWTKTPETPVGGEDDGEVISDWTRKDQKSQLELFSHFTNSISLYKSQEVYHELLQLLANGDLDIQKSALKAIFTWKKDSIKPYQENLLNLLDEARFNDEVSVLLQGQTLVQPDHQEELRPVLLRILYGRTISRKGVASGKQGMDAKRLVVLRNLSSEDIGTYLEIALGSRLSGISPVQNGSVQDSVVGAELMNSRKMLGVMNMIEAVLRVLKTTATPFIQTTLDATLYCTLFASRRLQKSGRQMNEEEDDELGLVASDQTSLLKAVRKTGLKCLILLFQLKFNWSPYTSAVDEIITPSLENLAIETAQAISGTLRLFWTWSNSSSPAVVLLLGHNASVLLKIAECILPEKSKDEVKLLALDIIRNITKTAQQDESLVVRIKDELLAPNIEIFLQHIGSVLRAHYDISKEILESCVGTVSDLSSFVTTSAQAQNLVDVSIFLLDQPLRRVNPKIKGELLRVLEIFVPLYDLQNDIHLRARVFNTVTSLFGFFTDNPSRQVLSRVLAVFSDKEPILQEVAQICVELNAVDAKRLNQPDFNRRLPAFAAIKLERSPRFTARQWRPLLFNMLYYLDDSGIEDSTDRGVISQNSSDGICSFIDAAAQANLNDERAAFKQLLSAVLIPAIYKGAKEQSEFVRKEYCTIMAHLVRSFPNWDEVSDMHGLLAGDDELESSFFNNILAIKKALRSSALGQISEFAEKGGLKAQHASHFFIPLIEHFILDRAEGTDGHNLAAEATATLGVLVGSLEWSQYRAVLLRYIGYVKSKSELEKQMIRLVGKVIDAIATAGQRRVEPGSVEDENTEADPQNSSTLSKTLPRIEKLADFLTTTIIPPLTKYLHSKDESTVSLRVPVAVLVVKLIKLLPEEQMKRELPAVITDVCQILRSKAQESRDMSRETLIQICVLLGPSYFEFILKELRGALKRGAQLHVVSYTMHSMLVASIPQYGPGDLDYCLSTIVEIIMNDIFGATGQEKDSEEYTSKMKEVKSSKSHDSMELVARTANVHQLIILIQPIKELLKNRLNLHAVHKIEDLLKRIEKGLLQNAAVHSRDSLVFCYQTIKDVYDDREHDEAEKRDQRGKPVDRRLLQKAAKKSGQRESTTTVYTHKLVKFAFDLMGKILNKFEDLRTANNITNLLPIIKHASLEAEEEVKIACFGLLTSIIKVFQIQQDGSLYTVAADYRSVKASPEVTKTWKELYRVAAHEAKKCILGSQIESSIFQESIKFLSVVFRNSPLVEVKNSTVNEALGRIKDHLTEPEYRHITFKFLRSVIDSNIKSAEVYDILDHVGNVMVQNFDDETRKLAREAFFQFLSKYEQHQKRWEDQIEFIVANLKYEREGGRLSVLALFRLLLTKTSEQYTRQISERIFAELIVVLGDDKSEQCRAQAAELFVEIFKRAQGEQLKGHVQILKSWISGTSRPGYMHIKLQLYELYYTARTDDSSDVVMLRDVILGVLKTVEEPTLNMKHILAALRLAATLTKAYPNLLFSSKTRNLWDAVRSCLSCPDNLDIGEAEVSPASLIKQVSSELVGEYLIHFIKPSSAMESGNSLPLQGFSGLQLITEDVIDITRRSAYILKKGVLPSSLADEVVKNLAILAKLAVRNSIKWRGQRIEDDESNDDVASDVDDPTTKKTLLAYLLERMSFILRKETSPPRALVLIPKTAASRLIQEVTSQLPSSALEPHLETILLPLHNLTDPSIPIPYSIDSVFRDSYAALKDQSDETMEILKRKVGTDAYTKALLQVREGVKARRAGRSGKRKIEAVTAPEKHGENKRKKGERKKERRKERGREEGARRKEVDY